MLDQLAGPAMERGGRVEGCSYTEQIESTSKLWNTLLDFFVLLLILTLFDPEPYEEH